MTQPDTRTRFAVRVAFGLVLAVSMSAVVLGAEIVARYLDGYPLDSVELPQQPAPPPSFEVDATAVELAARVELAPGVDPGWFTRTPPPLPGSGEVHPRLAAMRPRALAAPIFEFDAYKLWNRDLVVEMLCQRAGGVFADFPDDVFVFDPPQPSPHPRYRYPRGVTMPHGVVTNAYGWRGPELPLDKPPRRVRIAFVGASTTASPLHPHSYPEFIAHWLAEWARSMQIDVDFDVINAAREGTSSGDIAAVVEQEVLPLEPDIVVYYEGSNEFGTIRELTDLGDSGSATAATMNWRDSTLYRTSALARRTLLWLGVLSPGEGAEPLKRPYRLRWPEGVDESDPNLSHPALPVSMSKILANLEQMRRATERTGAELVISTFVWLVEDGMVLDPVRHAGIYSYLNDQWPFRYAHMRRLADFQNRTLTKYAATHGLALFDVAGNYPLNPELFIDAIHNTYDGVRLRAWVVMQDLVRLLAQRLANGSLPRSDAHPLAIHPNIPAREYSVRRRCRELPHRVDTQSILASSGRVIHDDASYTGRAPFVVTTPPTANGYAVEFPLDGVQPDEDASGLLVLVVEATARQGKVFIAPLVADRSRFIGGASLTPQAGMRQLILPLPEGQPLPATLLVANAVAADGQRSEVEIHGIALARVEPGALLEETGPAPAPQRSGATAR